MYMGVLSSMHISEYEPFCTLVIHGHVTISIFASLVSFVLKERNGVVYIERFLRLDDVSFLNSHTPSSVVYVIIM